MRILRASYDPLAQLAEQLPFKQWVRSSNLRRVTKKQGHDFIVVSLFFGAERLRALQELSIMLTNESHTTPGRNDLHGIAENH